MAQLSSAFDYLFFLAAADNLPLLSLSIFHDVICHDVICHDGIFHDVICHYIIFREIIFQMIQFLNKDKF